MSTATPRPAMRRALGCLVALTWGLSACQVTPGPVAPQATRKPASPGASLAPDGPPASLRPTEPPGAAAGTPPPLASQSASPGTPGSQPPGGGTPRPVTPAGTPAPALLTGEFLQKPASGATMLKGVVSLDASFLVAAGAGSVLSHNGGQLVAAGAGNLVAAGAGNLVAAGAGNLVAAGAGNVLSHNGGALVAAGAGNVISHNGGALVAAGAGNLVAAGAGNLVAAGAGNMIAAGAGNLVAAGAGNYALLQALPSALPTAVAGPAATPDATPTPVIPEVGAVMPAAGVEIAVWSLKQRAFLPLGTDTHGKFVYTVYSNLKGGYELYVPAEEQGNVLVMAVVDRASSDAHLTFGVVTGAQDAIAKDVDEDMHVATNFLRQAFATYLLSAFREPDIDKVFKALGGGFAGADLLLGNLKTVIGQVSAEARRLGLHEPANEVRGRRAALRGTDFFLRDMDLGSIDMKLPRKMMYTGESTAYNGPADEKPMAIIADITRKARLGAVAKLKANPKFFDTEPYLVEMNADRQPLPPFVVRRGSDLGDMFVELYLKQQESSNLYIDPADAADKEQKYDANLYRALRSPLRSLGILTLGPEYKGEDQADRLSAAILNILVNILFKAATLDQAKIDEIKAMLQQVAQEPLEPTGSPSPAPAASATPTP